VTETTMLHSTVLFAAAMALLFAAAHDVAVRTVPNLVSLIVALFGLGLNALDGQLSAALIRGGLVFAVGWHCWRRGWLGGGDVKLLGAASLIVSPGHVPAFICAVALAGGILALVYVIANRIIAARTPQSLVHTQFPTPGIFGRALRIERWRIRRGGPLPYACAIAAGFVVVVL
jgi:prepilin peptidase CpaA